jgi:hypothetical protein
VKRLLAAILLLTATSTVAQNSAPPTDCSIEVGDARDGWRADNYGVNWHHFTDNNTLVSAYLFLADAAGREALRRHGAFDPALRVSVDFGPQVAKARKPLWVTVIAGTKSIGPLKVSKDRGFYGSAMVSLLDLEPLLSSESKLTIVYSFVDGSEFIRSTVPSADIRAAIQRFPSLMNEYDARMSNPDDECHQPHDEIVVT